jgi:hypothetical protein
LVLRKLRESHGADTTLDLGGLTLITGGALGVVWGLVRSSQAGWDSIEVLATLSVGVVLLAAFVAWEARTRHPMCHCDCSARAASRRATP